MTPWMTQVLWCGGLLLLAVACMYNSNHGIRRLGVWLILSTILLGVWFASNSWGWVAAAGAAWFLVPMLQACYISRGIRLAASRRLESDTLDGDVFPEAHVLTRDLTEMGFTREGDYALRPSPYEQTYRLLWNKDCGVAAALAGVRQGGIALMYILFLCRDNNGQCWMTWNYPLAYGLKMPPGVHLYRCPQADSVKELFESHKDFMELNRVRLPADPEPTRQLFEGIFEETLAYNLRIGLLRQTAEDTDEAISYSWKGTAFVSWQVLCEVVRG